MALIGSMAGLVLLMPIVVFIAVPLGSVADFAVDVDVAVAEALYSGS